MKPLLLICFILSLLGSQAAITNFPGGPLESYKAYMRGVCAAVGVDCDLNSVSSCWDDASASEALNMMYQSWSEALISSPHKVSALLKTFFTEGSTSSTASVYHALHNEGNLKYAHQLYEKLGVLGHGFVGIIRNIIHYASIRPEDSYAILKNMAMLAEQGNFEAVGLLDGNFMVQASTLKKKEGADWRTHAKNNRGLLLKGMCAALGLDCPSGSLNCMNEKDSESDLQLLYEWFRAVATRPAASGHAVSGDYLVGRGKQIVDRISKSAIECDENSEEIKLINEKLGFDIWSLEWAEITLGFLREFPELGWHYKISEYELFDNGDLEGVGILLGLDWYQVAEWRHGRLERISPHQTLENEDL